MFERDLLSERPRVSAGTTALVSVETGERLTYAKLEARGERAAQTLTALGIGEGDRFGLLAYNCVEFLELFSGAMKRGAIVVPLRTRATAQELNAILDDCAAKLVFAGSEFAEMPLKVPKRHIAERLDSGLYAPAKSHGDESIACLLYTSGTTGKPKGVMIPRRQLLWNGMNTAVNWSLRDDDVSPIYTPLYHAGGVAAFTIPIFTVGGAIILHKSFDASQVWGTIERERCTVVLGVPTTWKMLMEAPEFAEANLDHVRWFISGGAPLPAYIADAYRKRGVVMKQGYGMTEVGVNCFTMTVEESIAKAGSIGRPMLFTEVRIAGADGNEVATAQSGEMRNRGPRASQGSRNKAAPTAAD